MMTDQQSAKSPHLPLAAAGVSAVPRRELTLFDSTCIILGIIIGPGIYVISPLVAQDVPNAWWLLAVWLLGGFLSLIGALCYAELGTAYPREGGDYVYLTRALGRPVGFIFAWCQLWIVRPGSIGADGLRLRRLCQPHLAAGGGRQRGLRAGGSMPPGSIVVLTLVNVLGVREGKWTQNMLTVAKVLGLAADRGRGASSARARGAAMPATPATSSGLSLADFGLAMIFVLFTYGGWNEMAYVGAEVKEPRKNILRALLIGTVAVTAIYVLVNLAFLHALGFEGARHATRGRRRAALGHRTAGPARPSAC